VGAAPVLSSTKPPQNFMAHQARFLKTIAHNLKMSAKRKQWIPPVANQSIKKGRPNKGYKIEDAVKLVSGSFASICQSLPCSV
jgi:hypothetical protein